MTPYEAYAIDQERCEQQQRLDEAMYCEGAEDAASAQLPQYADSAYLNGYVNRLQQLPTRSDGRICYDLPIPSISICEEF